MAKPPTARPESSPSRLDPQREADLMEHWLENQRMEMEIQKEQMRLKNREIDHDKALAEKSIDAQLEDRRLARTENTRVSRYVLIFLGLVILMLLVFGGYVISKDKESVLTEIIGLFTELLKYGIGAITGYFIAKAKFKTDKNNGESSE